MSSSNVLISTLRAIIRDELARVRLTELGTVTQVHAHEADDSAGNHQVSVKLRDSGLELQSVPYAVGRLGMAALPRVDDTVVVAFVGGDLNAPVALGSIYDATTHPPTGKAEELVYQPADDADDAARRFHLELPGGATLTLNDNKLSVVLGDTTVEVNKDGDIAIKASGKVSIEAGSDFEVTASGDVKMTAQGALTLKAGSNATVEGTAATKVKGAQITLAGITQFSAS